VEDCRWGSSGEEGEDDLSSDDEEDVVPFGLGSPMTGVTFADGAGDFDDSPATEDSDDSGEEDAGMYDDDPPSAPALQATKGPLNAQDYRCSLPPAVDLDSCGAAEKTPVCRPN
jgi:hypothetical protein